MLITPSFVIYNMVLSGGSPILVVLTIALKLAQPLVPVKFHNPVPKLQLLVILQ